MSDPVRKPTSEPPDVDSLMSRLDAGEPASDPSLPADGTAKPSAAELLGGRGRRARRAGIRVPDDAVPVSAPKPKRSVPPRPLADSIVLEPPVGPLVTPLGMPSLEAMMPIPSAPVTAPDPERASAPPASLLDSPSFIPEPTKDALASAPAMPVVVMRQRIISIGGPATPRPIIAPPAEAFAVLGPDAAPEDRTSGTQPIARSEPTPLMPGVAPLAPTSEEPPTEPPMTEEPPTPPMVPEARREVRAPTVPNLDATVREALAMLDHSDFDVADESVDIPVMMDEPAAASPGEDSLDDQVVEEVVSKKPPPPKRGHSEPAPVFSPQAATLPATLPQSPLPATTLPGVDEAPRIVTAAAASSAQPALAAPVTVASPPPAAPAVAQVAPSVAVITGEPHEQKRKKRQWFEELFNDDYTRALPRVTTVYLEREAKFIEESLGCEKGATILDLGCGAGEQAVAIASHGYEVIGVDLSLAMLARASDEAAEKRQRINFLQGDMRELTFEAAFDGVYCWGMTFGYFDDAKNAEVVSKVHRALRPGGRFLLDVNNRDFLACRLPSMVWFEGEGCVCMDEVQMNSITSRLQVKRTMMMEDGRQRELEYSIRLYALHELGKLLHDHGFRVAEASGDISNPGVFFGADSPRIMILAEKR